MKKKKLAALSILMMMVFLLIPSQVWAADQGLKATNFQVDVKPEYDDARTLVIYQGDFTNPGQDTIKKGTPISFIIPTGAEIGMACEINAQGGHECQPYTTKDLGNNKSELTWKSTKDIAPNQKYPAYLELYYDNGSAPPNKTFEFTFNPEYNLDNLDINIVPPKAATNFAADPNAASVSQDGDGLTNYSYNYKNQTPNDQIAIKVNYNKHDNKPTFDKTQTASNQGSDLGSGNWLTKPQFLIPIILIVVVLVIVIIFAFSGNKRPPAGKQSKASAKKVNSNKSVSQSGKVNQDSSHEKKKLRQMLLDGKITEETYKELLAEIDSEK